MLDGTGPPAVRAASMEHVLPSATVDGFKRTERKSSGAINASFMGLRPNSVTDLAEGTSLCIANMQDGFSIAVNERIGGRCAVSSWAVPVISSAALPVAAPKAPLDALDALQTRFCTYNTRNNTPPQCDYRCRAACTTISQE